MTTNPYTPWTLPQTGLVRLPVILHHFQISRSGWYQGIKDGIYPQPLKVGNKSLWNAADIHRLLAELTRKEGK